MSTVQRELSRTDASTREALVEARHEHWVHWPINWSAVWVGSLAAFSLLLVIGLVGVAVGGHVLGPEHRVVDLRKMSIGALLFSVFGTFFAFALGGWVSGKIAGILHSEPGMLHGSIVWLVTVPILVLAATLGAANFFGNWYAGLGGTPSWAAAPNAPYARPVAPVANATSEEITAYRTQEAEYERNVRQWNEDTPRAVRNSALGAVTALLLGLVGSVIGGWMASGEPMNFSHYRTRRPLYHPTTM